MNKIIFWNAERLSKKAAEKAQKAERDQEGMAKKAMSRPRRGDATPSRMPTRSYDKKHATRGGGHRSSVKQEPGTKGGTRVERAAIWQYNFLEALRAEAERLRYKVTLSEDLAISAPHTFLCEVLSDHPHARSPLLKGLAAGGGTLCYAHYQDGVSTAFTHCAITDGWYAGAALPAWLTRVPRGVEVKVTTGVHKGKAVRVCFWHAPSGNSGQIVAQMANGLHAGKKPFVLFGDLNAEPYQVAWRLSKGVTIVEPLGPTRISGRQLDYAVTNVPEVTSPKCRPLYDGLTNFKIKQKTGSDHMVMVFDLK